MYFNAFPTKPASMQDCQCWPIDCSFATGPCASDAPPWSRAIGCSGFPNCGTNQQCSTAIQERGRELQMRRKAEVLQYKNNSANLTKKQRWSQMVRGFSQNKKQVWATQNDTYTNPNIQNLQRVPGAFILHCPNSNQNVTRYPPSASNVPGKGPDLYLDKRFPAWGVGPRNISFSMGNVMHTRSHPSLHPSGPSSNCANPIKRGCKECYCVAIPGIATKCRYGTATTPVPQLYCYERDENCVPYTCAAPGFCGSNIVIVDREGNPVTSCP